MTDEDIKTLEEVGELLFRKEIGTEHFLPYRPLKDRLEAQLARINQEEKLRDKFYELIDRNKPKLLLETSNCKCGCECTCEGNCINCNCACNSA